MLFSQDPGTIDDALGLKLTDSPYVDQTIEIMSYNQAGAGVSIVYSNTGIASGTRSWNKFFDGLPDPDSEDPTDMSALISEPPIGPYKVFYRIGFADKPILYPGSGDASAGDQIDVPETFLGIANLYQSLPTCDDTALNAALAARNTAESDLASDSDFDAKILTSNSVKDKMNNEFNLRIWAYRQQFGTSEESLTNFNSFDDLITNSPYQDIMNAGSFGDVE